MLEWHAHAEHGWEYDTGRLGKRMRNWVDPEAWQSLQHSFAHFDADDSWSALLATIELYRRVAREAARMLGHEYLDREDKHMGDLIGRMRKTPSSCAQTREERNANMNGAPTQLYLWPTQGILCDMERSQ